MEPAAVEEVLGYWFGLTPEQWFRDTSLDAEIRRRFAQLWETERRKPAEAFLGSPRGALAATVLFDQFPRNMFRDQPKSFATDPLALEIAGAAIDRAYDRGMSDDERGFLYMPFQHSEKLADQERCVELFGQLDDPKQLHFAELHRDVIARFGRFPHRNPILGRAPTRKEEEAGHVVPW